MPYGVTEVEQGPHSLGLKFILGDDTALNGCIPCNQPGEVGRFFSGKQIKHRCIGNDGMLDHLRQSLGEDLLW